MLVQLDRNPIPLKTLLICCILLWPMRVADAGNSAGEDIGEAFGKLALLATGVALAVAGGAASTALTHGSNQWLHPAIEELPQIEPGTRLIVYHTGGKKTRGRFLEYRNREASEYAALLDEFYSGLEAVKRLRLGERITIRREGNQEAPIVGAFVGYAKHQILIEDEKGLLKRVPIHFTDHVETSSASAINLVDLLTSSPPCCEVLVILTNEAQVSMEIGEIEGLHIGKSSPVLAAGKVLLISGNCLAVGALMI